MPALNDLRHQAFARACARGARFMDAYQDAGFAPDRAYRLREAIEAGRKDDRIQIDIGSVR